MSHTTLEDVFLKLAKEGHASDRTEQFTLKISITKNAYKPGEPFAYGGNDGFDYKVPAELMPDQEKWDKMCKEHDGDDIVFKVKVPKQHRDAELSKKLYNCRIKTIYRTRLDQTTGLSLGGDGVGACDVLSVSEDGLAAKVLKEGDIIFAINNKLCEGHAATTAKLKATLGTITLHVGSSGDKAEDAGGYQKKKRYHGRALAGRWLPNCLRQTVSLEGVIPEGQWCCIPMSLVAVIFPTIFMCGLIFYGMQLNAFVRMPHTLPFPLG